MCFGQQRMTTIGEEKLLAVVIEYHHIRDAALEVGHIVHGILGILAVAIHIVAVLQQFGAFHPLHVGALLWRGDDRCLLSQFR